MRTVEALSFLNKLTSYKLLDFQLIRLLAYTRAKGFIFYDTEFKGYLFNLSTLETKETKETIIQGIKIAINQPNYLYFNDKEYHFFYASNIDAAKNKVINTYDLSFNPYLFEIAMANNSNFTVSAQRIDFLNIKKHFTLISVGNNIATFRI